MLSRWRKQVRDGVLKGELAPLDVAAVGELQRLRELEQKYKRLQVEHDILKKAIRFASELRAMSSPSSKQTGKPGRSR
jgi:transposase